MKIHRNVIKMEIQKAFINWKFMLALVIASMIALLSAVDNIKNYYSGWDYYLLRSSRENYLVNPRLPEWGGLFNNWICEDLFSFYSTLFFFLLPVIVVLPYGWSMIQELKEGYVKNIILLSSRRTYYASKYLAVFLSGGSVVTIPAILNILVLALFIPAITPDIFYDTGYMVAFPSMFSSLFYSVPLLYMLLRLCILFLFGGAIALLSFSLSFVIKNRFAVLLLPFMVILAVHYGQGMFKDISEMSPIYLLGAYGFGFKLLSTAVFEIILMSVLGLIPVIWKGGKADVF